jgi:DNA helicase-4
MALIKCPECGKQISDKSTACPYCGLPSEHYTTNTVLNEPSSSRGLLDCTVIKSLLVKYPNLLSPIAEIHNHLISLGLVLEEDVDRVKYCVEGKPKLHIYPSRGGGNSVTLQFIGRDKTSTISLTPTSNIEKTKQFISNIAQKEGLLAPGSGSASRNNELKDINVKELKNILISFDRDHTILFSSPRYIDTTTAAAFKNTYQKHDTLLKNELILQYVRTNAVALQIDDIGLNRFITKMQGLAADVEKHNAAYVDAKLTELKNYFDHIMDNIDPNIKLDDEQRRAVITDDNHCLLVAGAGAGKTTTMAAKVKYLVEKQSVAPQDIIVISYTNKAVNELKERINKGLGIPAKIATFHSFAFDIVRKAHEEPPEINISSYNIIYDMLAKQIFDNKRLMRNLVLFMGFYFDLPEDIFQFRTLNEYHLYKSALDYETLKSGLGEYVQKIAYKRSKSIRTITGEFLRSVQEVQIANFLYLNGIDYVYEKPYPYSLPRATKKYTPDFFISQGENEAYIEHYSLTEGMKSFIFSPQEIAKYQKIITDKRSLHQKKNTRLIETWSFYNDKRPLIDHLKEVLISNRFILKPRNLDEVYHKIVETGKDKYIYKLVWFTMSFIEQFKTSGYDDGGFDVLRNKTDNVRNLLYLDIAEEVYRHYQKTLKERNQIDFADMINDANFLLAEMERQGVNLSYKYIIIDEFQDIARQRFNLTKRLSDITHAKVVAVGDDWQSIYAFAGSDISLFTRFLELMGSGTELKITHTYRNSQELIDIAGNFVQKNSMQIKKQLISPKLLKDPIQLESYNDEENTYKNLANSVNSVIGKILSEFGETKSILLIGRYNFDLYKLQMTGEFEELYSNQVRSKKYPKANLTFMTAHSSKGLGYDNVIILNMLESRFGFPSQIEDDPIIKMVTYEDTSIPFAEERRLFYVALTRTKNRVYIATPLSRPSRFLIEIINDYNLPHPEGMNLGIVDLFRLKCPVCGFPLKYQFNKNYGLPLYTCTNEAEVCDFMTNDRIYLKDIFKCVSR